MSSLNIVENIIRSNDTNYIVGVLVACTSAYILQLKDKNNFYYDKRNKNLKIIINGLFILSILGVYSYNYVLSCILSILLLSMNL